MRTYVLRYCLKSNQRSGIFSKIPRVIDRSSEEQCVELKSWITLTICQAIKLYNGEKEELPKIGSKSKK